MFRAQEKIKTIEQQQNAMRNTLRQKIEHKIQQAEHNHELITQHKLTHSQSKSKFR